MEQDSLLPEQWPQPLGMLGIKQFKRRITMKTIPVQCLCCGYKFEVEVNVGRLLGSTSSPAKTAAAKINSSRPRPNARGKKKPRKIMTMADSEE